MKNNLLGTGIFVVLSLILFAAGLFLIGDKHKAFNRHVDYHTKLLNVEGLANGSKVRVSGLDAGQVTRIGIPALPSEHFLLDLHVEDKVRGLIRKDSQVSVETDGLVGERFLLIHAGTDEAQQAPAGYTLPSKEPIELSAILEKIDGIAGQAKATIVDVNKRVDDVLSSLNGTIGNANGLVTSVRSGHGTVGMLLTNEQTSQEAKTAIGNTRVATQNLDQITDRANQLIADLQSRNLPQKADDTINSAKHATDQLSQASSQLNASLTEALTPDRYGVDAAQNIRDSLANVNQSTPNLADDTEALKHEFLFRGFFRKRGFYTLADLTPEQYRNTLYFTKAGHVRIWIDAQDAFLLDAQGKEILSPAGKSQLDSLVGGQRESISGKYIVVEGYASHSDPANQLANSKARATLVKLYLDRHSQLDPKNVGVVECPAFSVPVRNDKTGIERSLRWHEARSIRQSRL